MSDERPPTQDFVLRGYDFDSADDRTYEFHGRLLAEATSRAKQHVRLVHDPDAFAPTGERCSACRWFEVRIYRVVEPHEDDSTASGAVSNDDGTGSTVPSRATTRWGDWVVETVGRTIVPRETDRRRVRRVDDPRRVVAALVQQRDGEAFIPQVSRRALDHAADRDDVLAQVVDDLLVFD